MTLDVCFVLSCSSTDHVIVSLYACHRRYELADTRGKLASTTCLQTLERDRNERTDDADEEGQQAATRALARQDAGYSRSRCLKSGLCVCTGQDYKLATRSAL